MLAACRHVYGHQGPCGMACGRVKGCLNQGQVQLKPSSPVHPSGEAASCFSVCGFFGWASPFLFCLAGQAVPACGTEGLRQKALLVGRVVHFSMAGLASAVLQTNSSDICPFSSQQRGVDRATHRETTCIAKCGHLQRLDTAPEEPHVV